MSMNRRQGSYNANKTTGYQYDFNGNRLSKLVGDTINGNEATDYVYEDQSNKLVTAESVTPSGRTAGTDNRAYLYNDANRVRSISIDNQIAGTYFYNDLGLRTRKIVANESGGSTTTVYHYNLQGMLIAETNETGQSTRDYLWNGMEPIAQASTSEGITYLHSDHLYTTRVATDELQTIVWQWESGAFGATEPQIEAREVNLRFPGQYNDAESGLYYNWNRYYDPGLGRYVTSDPIGLIGGMNTYGYVDQNPLMDYDIRGEAGLKAIAAALAAALQICRKNAKCRCRAMYAAYKAACGFGKCKGTDTCPVNMVKTKAALLCYTWRNAYIAMGCDRVFPTSKDHPEARDQAKEKWNRCRRLRPQCCGPS